MWQLIDEFMVLQSFSTLWFWFAASWMFGQAVHGVLGVPVLLVNLAWRETRPNRWSKSWSRKVTEGSPPRSDLALLTQMAHAQAEWRMRVWGRVALPRTMALGIVWGMLTALAFGYKLELARAIWLLATPLMSVGAIGLRAAFKISAQPDLSGAPLAKLMLRYNIMAQLIVFAFIFATFYLAFWRPIPMGHLG